MTGVNQRAQLIAGATVAAFCCWLLPTSVDSKCTLVNFGDSNSDTGGFTAGLGLFLSPLYGRRFFNRSTGRWSDGRLYVDFVCEELKINLLSPYLESSGSNFTDGINLAIAGANTMPNSSMFPLQTQVQQFLHFKNRTRELRPLGLGSLISEDEFMEAVYSFDIGQNDISFSFTNNLSYPQVVQALPATVDRIRDSIEQVYESGGRKFWIYNTGPLGCLPQTLALRKKNNSQLDPLGCLAEYNAAATAFNLVLGEMCSEIRAAHADVTAVYTDMYAIKYDLISNHANYGFDHPLMACCGHGGPPYNYANLKTCGQPTAMACPEDARFVSWDGVHYTEDANHIIAAKVLSGEHSTPRVKLKSICN